VHAVRDDPIATGHERVLTDKAVRLVPDDPTEENIAVLPAKRLKKLESLQRSGQLEAAQADFLYAAGPQEIGNLLRFEILEQPSEYVIGEVGIAHQKGFYVSIADLFLASVRMGLEAQQPYRAEGGIVNLCMDSTRGSGKRIGPQVGRQPGTQLAMGAQTEKTVRDASASESFIPCGPYRRTPGRQVEIVFDRLLAQSPGNLRDQLLGTRILEDADEHILVTKVQMPMPAPNVHPTTLATGETACKVHR
jgi:hypothetical protein